MCNPAAVLTRPEDSYVVSVQLPCGCPLLGSSVRKELVPRDDLVWQNPKHLVAQLQDDSAKPADTSKRRLTRQAVTSAYLTNSELAGRLVEAKTTKQRRVAWKWPCSCAPPTAASGIRWQ